MIHSKLTLLLALSLLLFAACAPVNNPAPRATELNIFAAASLNEAFSEIGAAFEAEHPGTKIVFNFAGSQQLVQQMAQGAPADIFASANMAQMEKAIAANLIDSAAPRIFAQNRLIIVLPKGNPGKIASLADLATPGHKLVLAAKEVPAGAYALQILDKAQAMPDFGADFSAKVLANVVSYEENVRAVLTKVMLGEADGGIVYQSDVTDSAAEKVLLVDIPNELNVAASYPAAVLKNSAQPDLARQFVDFLFNEKVQAILVRHGFTQVA